MPGRKASVRRGSGQPPAADRRQRLTQLLSARNSARKRALAPSGWRRCLHPTFISRAIVLFLFLEYGCSCTRLLQCKGYYGCWMVHFQINKQFSHPYMLVFLVKQVSSVENSSKRLCGFYDFQNFIYWNQTPKLPKLTYSLHFKGKFLVFAHQSWEYSKVKE